MGKCSEKLPFLNEKELEEFNEIGYTGKLEGIKTTREVYPNSLGKGTFKVIQTKFDTGDFTEKFLIILVQNEK